jgi:hypothetical protein
VTLIRYEYWAHSQGEKYLIRLDEANYITGVCGPLRQSDIPAANRHNFDYDQQPLLTVWVRANASEFHNSVPVQA